MNTIFQRIAASLLVVLAISIGPSASHAAVYGAETFTPKNGMQVVVIPNHRAPVVTHMVWYRAGAIDEPPGKSGIAHFLEHLMFKGTPKNPEGAINRIVATNGGDQNAFTSHDYTAYYQNIAVDRLPIMMELEADRMKNLILSEKDVSTEREVIIEERRMRVSNRPQSVLSERLNAAWWMTHRYGIPVLGWAEEMANLQRADALAFYKRFYSPENAILVVAGDISAEQLKPMAEKTYGKLKRNGDPVKRDLVAPLPPPASVRVSYSDSRVRQPQWSRQYVAPSVNVGGHDEVPALAVFAEILGGGSTSKLYRGLVVDQPIAASVGAAYDSAAVSYGTFMLWVVPNPGVSIEDAEAAVEKAVASVLDGGVTDEDVAAAKQRMRTSLVYAKDSPFGAAQRVGSMLAIGMSLDEIESSDEKIAAVTADQVRAAATKVLAGAVSATGILLPEGVTQ